MKKTLIALTLAALPVASMADVVLYGQIKGGVEVGFTNKVGGKKAADRTTTQIVDYGSRIGFKGHEHLNGDLKAIWQLESSVDIAGGATGKGASSLSRDDNGNLVQTNTASNGFGTRDSFIGLQGDKIGTVKAGYISSPVKDAAGRLDEWEYSSDVVGLDHFTRGTDASKRAVAVSYTTPNVAGFSATAYVSPSDNNKGARDAQPAVGLANTKAKAGRDAAIYGLGATYENSGFFADVAGGYVKNGANNGTINSGNPAIKEKDGYQAVANIGYENEQVLAGIGYNRTKNVDADYDVANEVAATVAYKVNPSLRLKGSAAHGFKLSDASGRPAYGNGKYYQGIVGADYALSKRTTVNGQVGYVQKGKDQQKEQYGVAGVGLKHKF